MLAHSPRDCSQSSHSADDISSTNQSNQNDSSSQIKTTDNSKLKKENDSRQRIKSLKSFIQTLINESTSVGTTYDEQMKTFESSCIEEYGDLSVDCIRRMIRNALKLRKIQPLSSSTHSHPTSPFLHKDQKKKLSTTNERFNSYENNAKKNRSNSLSNNSTTKADLVSSSPLSSVATLSAFDADFLRQSFSQQFRSSLDLSAYFSATTATPTNGTSSTTSLFRPNFSSANFLQSLTNTTSLAPPIPPPSPQSFVSSHIHTNGTSDSSSNKSSKLSGTEMSSIKVLVHAYREAASYLSRSADELEQLI